MPAEVAATATADAWQRVSAVVVTHHSSGVIRQCLEPLGRAAKIVVVDNASDDDTLDIVSQAAPDCEVLRNPIGAGYGNGASQGLARVQTEFALLANPDAVVSDAALARLVETADAYPDGALFGPTVIDTDGTVELSHDVGLFDRRDHGHRDNEPSPDGPCCAEFLSGAVTLLRMSAYREVGPFDPRLFLYYEDDDFCMRLRAARFSLIQVPDAVVSHIGGGSVRPSAHYYWEKYWHMAWSRLYIEEKYRGRAARRRIANANLARFALKALGNAIILRRAKVWRDLARLFGTAGYIFAIPASRTVPEARPPRPGDRSPGAS
ncbi:MAG: glycosyltransferase family 2 protein [Alphaproteobacteria bacterium]|nr:glycosyltransferase family 2 protein [Alphaproteobacteria bacterium]MCZ6840893.1 glycosyltransferase family 2 protein [Alphaproteobacteria bacterium]